MIRVIKLYLVIAAVSLVMVASTMVVNRYRIVVMVVMVVVVVVIMVVVVLQIPICHSSSSVLLGVKVERRAHRWRIRRVYY